MNQLLFRILLLIVTMMSPGLRKTLVAMLNALETEAKKTDTPADDILVAILKALLLGD